MENITENNKLIAEFMGSLFINEPYKDKDGNVKDYWYWTKPNCDYPKSIGIGELSTAWGIGNFHFHDDWNWLMSVVEKIENLQDENNYAIYNVQIEQSFTEIIDNHTSETIIYDIYADSKIEAVYNTVIEFIKWYNEQNKK